ncbi:MAG: hypothetical protein E7440_02880 [Ruminococcaceae bacterium]|nr:hypothetical protein [Oscillospiraceae bacterium]
MGRRKKWKMDLLSGQAAALILLGAFYFVGSVAGCIAAGLIRDPSGLLLDYIRGYLELLAQDGITGGFFSVFWESAKFPLMAVLLAFTALGIVGLPLLFAVRGFLLCYAVTVFYRLLGLIGLVPGFFLFGFSALIWMPVLFQLGVRGMLSAYGFLRRTMGDGRYPLRCDGGFLICCGICAAALCVCAMTEFFVVPALLQRVSGIFFSG